MQQLKTVLAAGVLALAVCVPSFAAQTTIPNSSNTTAVTANVAEQCTINLPATATFTVNDVTAATTTTVNVDLSNIILTDGHSLHLSLEAANASFTPPSGGSVTWDASDISWGVNSWTNGTGQAGSLSNASFIPVVFSSNNASELANATLQLTLAAKPTVNRAGAHTLSVTWKVESV